MVTPSLYDYQYYLPIKFKWIKIDNQYIDTTTYLHYTFLNLTDINQDMISDIDHFIKVMFIIGPVTEDVFNLQDFKILFKDKDDMMIAKLRLD